MQRRVMISCAVTGSADTPGRNPAVPVTPAQIAQSAIDAAKAGAAIVHIHVRDPQTTRPSMDASLYKEVVDRIRASGSDVLINLTTGPGARFVPLESRNHILLANEPAYGSSSEGRRPTSGASTTCILSRGGD